MIKKTFLVQERQLSSQKDFVRILIENSFCLVQILTSCRSKTIKRIFSSHFFSFFFPQIMVRQELNSEHRFEGRNIFPEFCNIFWIIRISRHKHISKSIWFLDLLKISKCRKSIIVFLSNELEMLE